MIGIPSKGSGDAYMNGDLLGSGFFVDGLGLHGLPGHPLGSSRKHQVQSIWG